eukprot:2709891-Rhodomonas_salina.1
MHSTPRRRTVLDRMVELAVGVEGQLEEKLGGAGGRVERDSLQLGDVCDQYKTLSTKRPRSGRLSTTGRCAAVQAWACLGAAGSRAAAHPSSSSQSPLPTPHSSHVIADGVVTSRPPWSRHSRCGGHVTAALVTSQQVWRSRHSRLTA